MMQCRGKPGGAAASGLPGAARARLKYQGAL